MQFPERSLNTAVPQFLSRKRRADPRRPTGKDSLSPIAVADFSHFSIAPGGAWPNMVRSRLGWPVSGRGSDLR